MYVLILPMFQRKTWLCDQLVKQNHLATGPHTALSKPASALTPLDAPMPPVWQEKTDQM